MPFITQPHVIYDRVLDSATPLDHETGISDRTHKPVFSDEHLFHPVTRPLEETP